MQSYVNNVVRCLQIIRDEIDLMAREDVFCACNKISEAAQILQTESDPYLVPRKVKNAVLRLTKYAERLDAAKCLLYVLDDRGVLFRNLHPVYYAHLILISECVNELEPGYIQIGDLIRAISGGVSGWDSETLTQCVKDFTDFREV